MTTKKENADPLTAAASALDAELARFEQTVRDLAATTITTEKGLQRARRRLEECGGHEETLSAALQGFAAAMQTTQARQHKCMEGTLEAAKRIEERFTSRAALLERMRDLGDRAKTINEPVASAMGSDPSAPDALLTTLKAVSDLTADIISEADALQKAAKDSEWHDIERDTDALKQQLQAARNKIVAAQRNVAERAPS